MEEKSSEMGTAGRKRKPRAAGKSGRAELSKNVAGKKCLRHTKGRTTMVWNGIEVDCWPGTLGSSSIKGGGAERKGWADFEVAHLRAGTAGLSDIVVDSMIVGLGHGFERDFQKLFLDNAIKTKAVATAVQRTLGDREEDLAAPQ